MGRRIQIASLPYHWSTHGTGRTDGFGSTEVGGSILSAPRVSGHGPADAAFGSSVNETLATEPADALELTEIEFPSQAAINVNSPATNTNPTPDRPREGPSSPDNGTSTSSSCVSKETGHDEFLWSSSG